MSSEDLPSNVIPFPKINNYDGFFVLNRPIVLPYENIGECKLRDFTDNQGNKEIIVSLVLCKESRISIIAADEEEAKELVKEFRRIKMKRETREPNDRD